LALSQLNEDESCQSKSSYMCEHRLSRVQIEVRHVEKDRLYRDFFYKTNKSPQSRDNGIWVNK